jgi:hypothetical protein
MTFIEKVRAKRQKLAEVLLDEDYSGIRDIVEQLYPDRAHFIYELLQNAEDTAATKARFRLLRNHLIFEHNGRPFDESDVWGITNIGKGGKSQQADKIGRFGVGFKAVFAYCDTPYIWSPTFSFKITNLVLPSALDPPSDLGEWTRFDFPFNNPKKSQDSAYGEIEVGLKELAETTLLFLPNLQSISWEIGHASFGEVRRVRHSAHHFEMRKDSDGRITLAHFLKFSRPVEAVEKQHIAVAFSLDRLPNVQQFDPNKPMAKQFRIAAAPGNVAVFFPAEKETSGLRFHLHAPFVPELSRASIKDTPANQPLFTQLASLTAASLHEIRDLGLLTPDFLSVLPNPQDHIPPRYQCVRAAVVDEMNSAALTPTHARLHAPAKHLLQAKASLKDLLSEDDIEVLVDYEEQRPRWAISAAQKNSNADRFLVGLAIAEWDVEQFVQLLSEKTSQRPRYHASADSDSDFMTWLSGRSAEWHQKLYAFLYTEFAPDGRFGRFERLKIVRLDDGSYTVASKCFFPSDGVGQDEVLPRVDAKIYTSGKGKTQQENAKRFLEEIGVRNVGEAEQAEAILTQRYTEDAEAPDDATHRKDLRRFAALIEKDPERASLFAEHWIFDRKDGRWSRPRRVFLDKPFLDTGLSGYYDVLGEDGDRVGLADKYQDYGIAISRLVKFAKAVGVQTDLEIQTDSCFENPQWSYLSSVGGDRRASPINRDYVIRGLKKVLAKPSLDIAKLVWRTMASLPKHPNYLKATYQRNQTWGAYYADSQVVHHLRRAAWIPQGSGLPFVRPRDASRELLPEGFAFDSGWEWLKAIGFGDEAAKKSEEQRQKEVAAKKLGFSDSASLERAKRFAALPLQEQERILADLERAVPTELPEHEPVNPERRAQRVGVKAANAPERRSEERIRSISSGLDDIKQEATQYLSQQYTNADDEMICQICKGPLPFKLDDGSAYFEKVEFVATLKKRHYQNYLALCPNHAAMFMYANGSADLSEALCELTANELEVVLAQRAATIYFTKTHIADLKEVIRVDRAVSD